MISTDGKFTKLFARDIAYATRSAKPIFILVD